jgi:CBS domain-containing protein
LHDAHCTIGRNAALGARTDDEEVDVDRKAADRRDIKLREIMHPAVSVSPDDPARQALRIMLDNRVPGVPVVNEEGVLQGVITDAVLLDSAVPKYLKYLENLSFVTEEADKWVHYIAEAADKPVREVMSDDVSSIELGHSEIEAAHKMVHDGVPSVVITESGKPVGVVSRLDLYAAIAGIG